MIVDCKLYTVPYFIHFVVFHACDVYFHFKAAGYIFFACFCYYCDELFKCKFVKYISNILNVCNLLKNLILVKERQNPSSQKAHHSGVRSYYNFVQIEKLS